MECEIHHDPLKVYCETCQKLICRDCTFTKQHQSHNYSLITDSFSKHYLEIQTNLNKMKKKTTEINAAVTNLVSQEREVIKQGEDVKEEIHKEAKIIIHLVQQSQRHLTQQVDIAVQRKIQLLTKQREEAEKILNRLKGYEEFVEQNLNKGSQQQVLRDKQSMIQVMTTVNQDVDPVVFQPIEQADIIFTRNQTLVDKYEGIGELNCKFFGKSVLAKKSCYVNKKSTVTLNLQTHNGLPILVPLSLISCELSLAGDSTNTLIACDIKGTQSGIYDISFIPLTRGRYELMVRLGGVDIPGNPFTLCVFPTPEMRGKPVNIISGLNRPHAVVVSKNGEMVVAESVCHCVTILNKDGKHVRSFGTKGTAVQFSYPCGVAISQDGHILVTDENQLQKLTFDGQYVNSVGSSNKKGYPRFNTPSGIAVHPTTGHIYIADTGNHRIQVLNDDFTFNRTFGKKGSAPEQFNSPRDVAFDDEGYLYVVDTDNHCIKKFTSTGQYISKFSSKRYIPSYASIAVDNNFVYVSECDNHCVSIYDIYGCFVHCFGKFGREEGEFNMPYGVTVDSLGNLYVCDIGNGRLVVL